jgi:quinol-cytochrome oxidoreductase complex cytochrome b subunit
VRLAQGSLASLGEAARVRVDWDAMERAIRARPRARRRHALITAAFGAACIGLAIWGLPPEGQRLGYTGLILAATVPIVVLRLVLVFRGTGRALELTARQDVFDAERTYLARRLRLLRTMRWVAILVVASGFVNAWFAHTTPPRIAYVGMSLIIAGIWLYAWRVTMPELVRQASELEPLDPKG